MAQKNLKDTFDSLGVDPFDSPIPGESLTADPNTSRAWEQPPKFTNIDEALQELFIKLTDEEVYPDLMDNIREGMPLDMITQAVLFQAFASGAITTDLMITMIEPTLYILIGLAEHNGIYDYTVYEGEDEMLDEEELIEMADDDIQRMQPKMKELKARMNLNAQDVLPNSLLSQIKSAPMYKGGEE
jgi:hypothetical protein